MNLQFSWLVRAGLKWIAVIAVMGVLVASAFSQGLRSIFLAYPDRTGTAEGMSFKYHSPSTRVVLTGSAGHFVGDFRDWTSQGNSPGSRPSNIAQLFNDAREHHIPRGPGTFISYWADNVRTYVILAIDLSKLPGYQGTGARIETFGTVIARGDDTASLAQRVAEAFGHAAYYMPHRLYQNGVKAELWERLKAASDPNQIYGGAVLEVIDAYDYREGGSAALTAARKLLADQLVAFRRAKSAPAAIKQMAHLHASAKVSETWAEARRQAEANDLPAGWAFRAWEAMDRNDYGPATIGYVSRAEQALQRLKPSGERDVTFAVVHAALPGFGPSLTADGGKEFFQAYRYNAAYVGYTRGILEENLASRAAGEAAKKKHTDAAREAFRLWRQNDYGDDDEEGLWRNTQDDVKLGWDDPFLLRARAIAQHDGRRGFGVNRREALAAFQRAEALGSIDSKNWIGLMLDRSSGVTNDPVAAVKKFQEAANLGNHYAKANLAKSLAFGVGILRDMTRAKLLYKEAAQPHKTWDKFFDGTLGTHWLETSSSGDVMEVTLMHDGYPVSLKTLGEQQGIEGRSLKFKVSYKLSSIASARIRPVVDRSISNYSPAPVLQDEGEHVLWIASAQTTLRETDLPIEMVDAATDKVILKLQVPVLARWDR